MMLSLQVTTQQDPEDRNLVTVFDDIEFSTVTKVFQFFLTFYVTLARNLEPKCLPICSAFIANKIKIVHPL
jgi:hypothetical protein